MHSYICFCFGLACSSSHVVSLRPQCQQCHLKVLRGETLCVSTFELQLLFLLWSTVDVVFVRVIGGNLVRLLYKLWIHSHLNNWGNLGKPINLTCMPLDFGRKPEYQEKTHTDATQTCFILMPLLYLEKWFYLFYFSRSSKYLGFPSFLLPFCFTADHTPALWHGSHRTEMSYLCL